MFSLVLFSFFLHARRKREVILIVARRNPNGVINPIFQVTFFRLETNKLIIKTCDGSRLINFSCSKNELPVYSILHLAFSFLITYRLGYKMVIK